MRQCPILMYHWFRPEGTPSENGSHRTTVSVPVTIQNPRDVPLAAYWNTAAQTATASSDDAE